MTAKNDVTGDKIRSKATVIPAENWEAVFGNSTWAKWRDERRKEREAQRKDAAHR